MAEPKADKGMENAPGDNGAKGKAMPMMVIVASVVVFAAAGFFVGRSFGTGSPAQTASAAPSGEKEAGSHGEAPAANANEPWFYELEPVVVTLNDPGITRYIRISLTLEIVATWSQEEARTMLDQKKPLLKHWLTLYLSNQTLEDARGKANLVRMQSNIGDIFNQGLFPNSQPRITNVFFKEFAIQ